MGNIQLVDVSLRDGNQSTWGAVGVTRRMVEGVTPHIDRVGYRAIEIASSTIMAMSVRRHLEDPWETLRAARDRMPNTPRGILTTGKRFITFGRTPAAVFELAFTLLARNGVRRLWVVDPMNDMEGTRLTAEMAKRAGFEDVVAGVTYTTSPVHTHDYYAQAVAAIDSCEAVDSMYLKDPAGLLTPESLRELYPRLQGQLNRLQLNELHSHATTGMSPLTLLEAADLGFTTLHSALPPLANGSSHPSGIQLARNLRARGHSVDVDIEAMQQASAYLTRQAKIKRLAIGVPNEYDEDYYRHTIPGGVQTTLSRQLTEMGRPELFDAVIEESVRVREDLGWPIVMTPFAQYVVTQATLNVMTGERYKQISDEVIDLLKGDFGPMPGPVNQDLFDRALATPRGKQALPEDTLTIADLRRTFGSTISDEELLLRAVMPGEQVDAMVAQRDKKPVDTLKRLLNSASTGTGMNIAVSSGDTSFTLTKEQK